MNRYRFAGRAAAGPAAALAVAGLLIAGCSSGSPGGSGSSGSGGSQANSPSANGSSGSGSGASTTAGSPLFPIAVGEKWVYADHLGSLGSSTTVNTIKAVKPASGGNLVTMTDSENIDGTPKTTKLTYMFYSDGSIGVPFTELSGGKVRIKSGSIVWPSAATIASGQSHTSVLAISIKTAGQVINEKVHVTVKGGGTASVTVPAGTYNATVVDQTEAETFLGHHVSIELRTWLAPNVGPVKSEIVSKSSTSGIPQVVEELKSFSK
jgi:hypothetical protein